MSVAGAVPGPTTVPPLDDARDFATATRSRRWSGGILAGSTDPDPSNQFAFANKSEGLALLPGRQNLIFYRFRLRKMQSTSTSATLSV